MHGERLQAETSEVFDKWLDRLGDEKVQAIVTARIDRLRLGNPGDVASVGGGVHELRIHFGPGYRVYYSMIGTALVLLLAGGDKSSQKRDIATAKKLAIAMRAEAKGHST